MSNPPDHPIPEKSEELVPGLNRDWHRDNKIVVYRLTSVSADTLKRWSESALQLLREWPTSQPCLILNDLTYRGVALSFASQINFEVYNAGVIPTARAVAEMVVESRPDLKVYIAYVFNSNFSGNLGHVFAKASRANLLPMLGDRPLDAVPFSRIKYNIFLESDPAYSWLLRFSPRPLDNTLPLAQ